MKNRLVLVAEDDFASFQLMEEYLLLYELEVVHAVNGEEAIEKVKQHQPVLVFMDIRMPVMRGDEAMRILKKEFPDIPVIAQTAYAMKGDEHKFLQEGFDGYLSKPVFEEPLEEVLKQFLDR